MGYVVIKKTQLDELAQALRALILTCQNLLDQLETKVVPLRLPEDKPETRTTVAIAPKSGSRGTLAGLLYKYVPDDTPFTPRQALKWIEGKYPFRGNRQADSVRFALRKDDRFKKLKDGRYIKVSESSKSDSDLLKPDPY